MEPVSLRSARLLLRPFNLADAGALAELAQDRAVAATTLNVPHPYDASMAEGWIGTHAEAAASGSNFVFAITVVETGTLVGCISLGVDQEHRHGELGYWLGVPFWGRGYMTEAAAAVRDFGFETLQLQRVYAQSFVSNTASARVQEKIGLRYEGCRRSHFCKWGQFQDDEMRGLLRDEWLELPRGQKI